MPSSHVCRFSTYLIEPIVAAFADHLDPLRAEAIRQYELLLLDPFGGTGERLRAENDAMRNMLADSIVVHHDDQAEIDRLRAESAAFRDLAGCCSDCEWEGVEIVHRPMCARWQSAEIAEVAGRIANGAAVCGATWRDTEARGWLWYCSLPVGHAGHHRCIGATW